MPNVTTANELALEFVGGTLFAVAGSFDVGTAICRLNGSVFEKFPALPIRSIAPGPFRAQRACCYCLR